MTNTILINNPRKSPIAENVLILNGFKIVSNWCRDGIYQKDGINYNFAGWDGHKIKLIINI
jgi:hypothetical protein